MDTATIVRAWRDVEYRSTLSSQEKAKLPSNPAGTIEVSDDTLGGIAPTFRLADTDYCTCFGTDCWTQVTGHPRCCC